MYSQNMELGKCMIGCHGDMESTILCLRQNLVDLTAGKTNNVFQNVCVDAKKR
jgi:hypothetical protein